LDLCSFCETEHQKRVLTDDHFLKLFRNDSAIWKQFFALGINGIMKFIDRIDWEKLGRHGIAVLIFAVTLFLTYNSGVSIVSKLVSLFRSFIENFGLFRLLSFPK